MDGSHITEIELENYARGGLASAEFLRVHGHLENCDECKRRIDDMFPTAVADELTTLLDDGAIDTLPEFHLNYEDHFRPYIEEIIGPVEKELIEGHAETCLSCREDLRDIVSFHRELKQESELKDLARGSMIANLSAWLFTSSRRLLLVAFAASLVVSIGSVLLYLINSRVETTVQNIGDEVQPENPAAGPPIVTPPTEHSRASELTIPKNDEEPEVAKLTLPSVLRELRVESVGTLRGNDDSIAQKITVIAPNGLVIRSSSPVLRWRRVANEQSYDVAIFDANDNRIAKADSIKANSWRVPVLAKGRVYRWQVSANVESSENKAIRYIGQGKFYIVSDVDEKQINKAKSPLLKGRAYAEAGLLREAASEFRKYLAQNPDSANAIRLLKQVEEAQR
ncbi:MAG: hypothetical protein ABL999_19805 [Pyrinomonadaceae bacterium]